MHSHITIKNYRDEARLFRGRVRAAIIIMAILCSMLICRLAYLQILHHQHYQTLSQNNQMRAVPLSPTRGLIYDRHGELLAENLPVFTLTLTPELMRDVYPDIAQLQQFIDISEDDIEDFNGRRKRSRPYEAIPLKFRLNETEVAAFSVQRPQFPGVHVEAGLIRHYPHGPLFAHTLGHVGRISAKDLTQVAEKDYRGLHFIGKVGLEKKYEALLRGQVGYAQVEADAKGRFIRQLSEQNPMPGADIHLTLDAKLQAVADKALGKKRGAVVAIAPKTGEVLALVSKPDFDPNLFINGIDQKTYQAIHKSAYLPMFNRAIQGQYPPASTIKPLIGLLGLEYKAITDKTTIYDPGWFQLNEGGRRYRDWYRPGHGKTDLSKAIYQSCDTFYYYLSDIMGINKLSKGLKVFGLGYPTGIDLLNERAGLIPTKRWKRRTKGEPWYAGETLNIGIGQGFMLATPLQLANLTALMANRGDEYKPHLVRQIGLAPIIEPELQRHIMLHDDQHWDTIIKAMEDVVKHPRGTAHRLARNTPYRIAGKTGTAQVFSVPDDEVYIESEVALHLRDHTLFVAFAPIDAPEIAISVVVENHRGATDVAKKVMDAYLRPEN